jgi:hypothetical protein
MSGFQQSAMKSTGGKSDRKRLYKKRSRPMSDEDYVDPAPQSSSAVVQVPAAPMTTRQSAVKADVSCHVV